MNTLDSEKYYLKSYTPSREDLYLQAIFCSNYKGFYVDVGSGHPIHHSATKLLYRSGWHGINIDPNRELMELTVYDRQRDVQLCCGVGGKAERLTFRQYHNPSLSTFSREVQQEHSAHSSESTDTYEDIEVEVRTLKDIFTEHKVKAIDLLKVDVEGYEQEVLMGNDWKRFRPKIVCARTDRNAMDWTGFMQRQGYQLKTSDGLNDYYVDAACEFADTPVRLVETMLAFPHVVDSDVAGYLTLQQMQAEVADMQAKAMRQPARRASVGQLKEDIRRSVHELKALVKQRSRAPRASFVPSHEATQLAGMTKLDGYLERVGKTYRESYRAIRSYEDAQLPKSKAAKLAHRAKMAGYHTPRLILGEAGRIVRRRLK